MPSELSMELTCQSGRAAASNHDTRTNSSWATNTVSDSPARILITLFFIGMEIIDVEDVQFEGAHHKTCSIDINASVAAGEEFLDEVVLTFLKTLHAKGHTAEVGNLFFGIS